MESDKRIGRKAVRGRQVSKNSSSAVKYTLQQAFDMFFHAKAAEGLRKRTLADYKTHHRYFVQWLALKHPDVTLLRNISPHRGPTPAPETRKYTRL